MRVESGEWRVESREPTSGGRWQDDGVVYCAIYFCVYGLIVLILDAVSAARTGTFAVGSALSLPVARILLPVGLVASLACLARKPSSLLLMVGATALIAAFGLGTYFVWTPTPW